MKEKAILIGLITPQTTKENVNEYLDELSFLATTAGAVPTKDLHSNSYFQIKIHFLEKAK